MSLPLLHEPIDVLSRAVITLGWASDPTANPLQPWPLAVNDEPDTPDRCLTLYDTTPKNDGTLNYHQNF